MQLVSGADGAQTQQFPSAIVLLMTGSDSGGHHFSQSDAVFCQDGCITCFSLVAPWCILGFFFFFTSSEACT